MTVHERDCAPCDAARAAAYALMEHWDPNEAWAGVEALDGDGTLYDEAVRIVAEVLHRYPLGGAPARGPQPRPIRDQHDGSEW